MNTDWVSSAQFTAPDSPLGKMKQRQQRQGCGMLVDQTSFFNLSRVLMKIGFCTLFRVLRVFRD
jgi:hypothetical protein